MGPGKHVMMISLLMASRINKNPGSDIQGVPASVIKENENAIKEAIKTEKTVNEAKEETKSMFSGLFEIFNRMLQIFKYSTHSIQNLFFKIGAIIWTLYHLLITQINTISIQIYS